jgi:hypothetical protein
MGPFKRREGFLVARAVEKKVCRSEDDGREIAPPTRTVKVVRSKRRRRGVEASHHRPGRGEQL